MQHNVAVELPAPRGAILSSDGRGLAIGQRAYTISADPRHVAEPARVAAQLTATLGGNLAERMRLERLLRGGGGYVVLAKDVDPKRVSYLRGLGLAGVSFDEVEQRFYPQGRLAGQVLGLVQADSEAGISGIERRFDPVLRGAPGRRVEVRDAAQGRTVRIQSTRDPVPGRDVELTINSAVQQEVEDVLATTRKRYGAKSAWAIVMDPRDGAILAMANVPRVNPNNRASYSLNDARAKVVTDDFEPGSVFKVVTMAGALEEGLVRPSQEFTLPPQITLYRGTPDQFTLGEAHKRGWERWSATEILQKSSNIGTVEIANLLRRRNHLRSWIGRFGFGKLTGVDFDGESPGVVPKVWSGASPYNIPIGQGLTATELQLARAYAAVANGGFLVRPHVVARAGGRPEPEPTRRRIISAHTAHELTAMLQKVVNPDGTGVNAEIDRYTVAGKTGTAQKVDPKLRTYVDRYRSSFIGFVPASRPRLLVSVMVDDPDVRGPHTGGEVAAPAFRQIAEFALNRLGIPPG
jgi:cell division protein FtsI (penicillin-binding protein 3)